MFLFETYCGFDMRGVDVAVAGGKSPLRYPGVKVGEFQLLRNKENIPCVCGQ